MGSIAYCDNLWGRADMTPFLALLVPVTALLLHIVVTHTLHRSKPPVSRQRTAALLSLVNCLGWSAGALLQFGLSELTAFFAVASASLSLTYFLVWNCTVTARRVRILVGLYSGHVSAEAEPYSPTVMIRERIRRVEGMGALRREGEKLYAVPGILLSASLFFRAWRKFFRCDELERFHA